ncbi:MAG TPA: hypothetical protein VHE81_00750, partial [Lacipirellulaceae bacterium]|nr:hypothetical protein [Lacipirellulaceae bacterium]
MLAVFTVTNLTDAPVAPAGSLRDAINQANASAGADSIQFAAGLTGTLNLAAGAGNLDITDPVTINGPGAANLTIDATAAVSRIFNIEDTAGNVAISGLTLTKGNAGTGAGGAIYSASLGMLTISNSVVSGNTAGTGGGIFATGDLIISGTTVGGAGAGNTSTAQGGGIYAGSMLMLSNSTVSGNTASAGSGGGIFAAGSAMIENSTIGGLTAPDANTSGVSGGGIDA